MFSSQFENFFLPHMLRTARCILRAEPIPETGDRLTSQKAEVVHPFLVKKTTGFEPTILIRNPSG